MIKGNQKEKYVGFTLVKLKAINPTREELNKLLGKEASEDDKEISYITQDSEGKDRVRLSFWLHDENIDKWFVHSFNLTNKFRTSKDGVKNQYVNNTCITAWADTESNLPDWFTHFMDKSRKPSSTKEFRRALLGEEELVTLVRSWLARINWRKPGCSVMLDVDKLLAQDYSELREMINGPYDVPFVILTGVRTDENDNTKQYQQVYGKSFLPESFLSYIENGFKFPNEYAKKTWTDFEKEVTGMYGFNSYFELEPLKEYDPSKDILVSNGTKVDVTATNAKF